MVLSAFGQRPRVADNSASDPTDTPPPAPTTVKVKYEGGVFGYNQKQDGTLLFDDANRRLVFRNKFQKEVFPIPYDAVLSTFADTQAKRPTAASILSSAVPYGLGLPALFIKKKYRYLTLQFEDPDTGVSGVTSFKVENKEILSSVVYALATKAGLVQRGEVFVRRPNQRSSSSSASSSSTTQIIRVDDRDPVSGGVLNGRAISLPQPVYPADAREANVSGAVTVQVTIDEEGKVILAKAVSGHPLLQDAAVDAALKARFTPMQLAGQPVKVSGVLTYNFELR
jgi:TonB family protein